MELLWQELRIVTGIGFVGAGSILKLSEEREIKGLTTAAGLWMTAAIGIAVGLGEIGVAVIGTYLDCRCPQLR